jgi:hypothetical protein
MKSFKELYEELGMSAADLGTGDDGVLGPDDNRIPKRMGKIQRRKSIEKVAEEDEKFTPPKAAKKAAQQAIDWKEEHGDEVTAMTQTGWVRARQLANGDEISYDIVKRMAAFVRHKKNSAIDPKYKDTPWKDAGYVSYLGWGGDEGIEWAQKIMQSKT